MIVGHRVLFFEVLTFLWTLNRAEAVDCVFMKSCILPCSFQPGEDVVVHWYQGTTGDTPVHSFYHNQDQTTLQNQRFRGRTSLFKEQVSRGNASLQLSKVQIQDQNSFKCYTSTIAGNEESIIKLNVNAPVSKVSLQRAEDRITCSSEGIYPEPELSWSTNPPSNMTLQSANTVQQSEELLYNISSSLTAPLSGVDYSCTVSTGTNKRRATLFKAASINSSHYETRIPCTSSDTPLTGLIWRFNHSQVILNQTGPDVPYTVSEEWRQQVKSVSKSGSLTLQDLSSQQEGVYTCELSDAEETYLSSTTLRIRRSPDSVQTADAGLIAGVVVAIIAAGVIVVLVVLFICKKTGRRKDDKREADVVHPLRERHSNEHELETSGPNGLRTNEGL